ncbi:MAG TPA: amino acid ABC transporter substrate-binding protein [Aggregatilineaceae bacterium]|nr:amino acid ABC transporter substrate-binding protein [Aggregatilineaceae bacterium]
MKKVTRSLAVLSLSFVFLLTLCLPVFSPAAAQETTSILDEVRARGKLLCGVNGQVPGFSFLDPETGEMSGFDADFCRAIAAAVFGEATADNVEFVPTTANERFTALQTRQIDVLVRNTTWTLQRDGELGIDFGPVTYYDGQGVMVRADLGVATLDELNNASICTLTGTTTQLNITEAMESRGLTFELVPFEESSQTIAAFEEGRCDALTSDQSQLAGLRSAAEDPGSMVVLPEVISKEPLTPSYLEGDSVWGDVVDWAVYATFTAEEFGITQANVDEFLTSEDSRVQRFLGIGENASGSLIGLDNDFAANVIRAVGNYGEIYERNVGIDTPLGLDRAGGLGLNRLWSDGGLIYAPAWR